MPRRPLAELQRELLSRTGRGAEYGLERMYAALETLGHPERDLPVVHVAGTNGKGSVCAMMTSIGRAAGLRTGTFTSPHLCRLAERIRLDGEPIEDDAFASALDAVLHPSVPDVTFFEAMTLAGFVAMRRAEVDLAIFEVGLGGRLDATNVVPEPLATAVVSVALDHTRILGPDHASIAREKAAIAKAGAPMVLGPLPHDARRAAVEVAVRVGATPIWLVTQDAVEPPPGHTAPLRYGVAEDGLWTRSAAGEIRGLSLGLEGEHQRANAAVAVGLTQSLEARRVLADAEAALRAGLSQARWPGRLERITRGAVTVLLDCAHNPHAADALARALRGQPPERTLLVFGALGDKAWPRMIDILGPLAHERYYCEPLKELAGRRPVAPSELAERLAGRVCTSPEEALEAAFLDADAGETIVVAGSIFLTGAARAYLLNIDDDPAVPL